MRRFVAEFLLPLVRGGALHVGRPLGPRGGRAPGRRRGAGRVEPEAADARSARAAAPSPRGLLPPAAAAAARRGDAPARRGACTICWRSVHPGLAGPGLGDAAASAIADGGARAGVGRAAGSAREAVNRHSLLARLPEIARVDSTVHFWLGRQLFVGRTPPRRVTAHARAAAGARRAPRSELAARDRHSGRGAARVPGAQRGEPARRGARSAAARSAAGLGPHPARAARFRRWPAWSRGACSSSASSARATRSREALYRFASLHDPPVGLPATAEAVAFALRFLAHLVWLDVLFGGARPPAGERRAAQSAGGPPEPGIDLAVVITAAARTRLSLVWPADVAADGRRRGRVPRPAGGAGRARRGSGPAALPGRPRDCGAGRSAGDRGLAAASRRRAPSRAGDGRHVEVRARYD